MTTTPNLGIAYIDSGVPQPEVTHNDAMRRLDALVQIIVQDRDLASPPGSPSDGQCWIVASSPTGAWAGHTNHVLAWQDNAWRSYVPKVGWRAYVVDEGKLLTWSGSAWGEGASIIDSLQNMVLFGLGTTADSTNPLSAKLNNTLWAAKTVAEGGDGNLRYKLSKESAAKTLSFLLQTNFSGRAELGLTGDDDFHFKVSPDGTTWAEALTISRNNGGIRFLAAETDVASAATCDIGSAANLKVQITGTTTITSFGTVAHAVRLLRFAGALTLTYNATSLILPTGNNITTAAGDTCVAVSDPSGNWRVRSYQKADGTFLVAESNVASAATCDIGAASTAKVNVTGTTTITSLGAAANALRFIRFSGALTLTHNATSLILPGAANITTAAGDTCVALSDPSGNWRLFAFARTSGKATVPPTSTDISDATATGRSILTAANAPTARAAVLAAPIEAMAGLVLNSNPGMEVDQEHAGASTTLTGTGSLQTKYLVDGTMAAYRGTFVAAAQQVSDCPAGYLNSLKFTVSTAQSSIGANDELSVLIPVEGLRSGKLSYGNASANALAIFFWVKAHRTGSYSGSLRNSAKARSYPFSFTVGVADTWEYKSVLIATGDTTGTWLTTAGVGLYLTIAIAGGSSRVGTANAWAGSDFSGVTSTTNGVAATSDVFQITGVGTLPLVAGVSVADVPDLAHAPFIVRPFDDALALALRYYEKSYDYGSVPGAVDTNGQEFIYIVGSTLNAAGRSTPFKRHKRATPTITTYSPATGTSGKVRDTQNSADVASNVGQGLSQFLWFASPSVNGPINFSMHWVADARL
jgi:hypothetical protein